MGIYIFRRLLSSIPVLFGVLIITFILARSVPFHPCEMLLGDKWTPEMCERLLRAKGMDKPIPVQFVIYMQDVIRGDFGNSIRFNRPVIQILVERLPATVELSVTAFLIAVAIGIPAGIISAINRNSPIDVTTMIGANIGVSMPVFWLGLILMYVFAVLLRDTPFWLPPTGRVSVGVISDPFYKVYGMTAAEGSARFFVLDFLSNLYIFNSIITLDLTVLVDTIKHLILPAVTLSMIPLAIVARLTRSSLLEELGANYMLTARAKGLRYRIAITKHGFPNALLPIVTIMGLQIGGLLSGAILTETIFAFPGLGRMLFESIVNHDYPVVQMITL
ncbi:MAG: ABC transporter permease, partial [Chloroflexi bacterium]|nr:ABC transporter permease [Chloroflexota bacterium]